MRTLSLFVFLSFSFSGLLHTIDGAFGQAQNAVMNSPLPSEEKSSVSNVLKTKHDTVKNSIGNIR